LKDAALAAIKEAILSNKLEPGVRYAEATLANQLGISRTPVREALIHLASQRLIIYFPRRGFQIRSLTVKDVHNLFEVRLSLELAVVRHIVPSLRPEDLNDISESLSLCLQASQTGDRNKSIRANRAFHLCLAYLTKNNYLIDALEGIYDLIDLANARSLEFSSRYSEVGEEHSKILKELSQRNLPGALKQMETHIRRTEKLIVSMIGETNAEDGINKQLPSRED
jgi:DNA-binding GntR family transcriptional regulator